MNSIAKKIILKNWLSPGDTIMLTGAVRDLHKCYPDQYITDVRTPSPQLWENNPYITTLDENDEDVELVECYYDIINQSNWIPKHFIYGFIENLNQKLNLNIEPTSFSGDIHLSIHEKSWWSQIQELTGEDTPFWIIVAGGKYDFTIKWWEHSRFQQIVDHFRGQILFVQVGSLDHCHMPLRGVIDLRGKTDLRQLVRLVHHSHGVLCPVTSLMHLAAAVPQKGTSLTSRPCVVIAGGREPSHWEAYPQHQYLHTNGALACCQTGGCWRARTVPLGDDSELDHPHNLCLNVVDGKLPRCMDMISAEDVIEKISLYYRGGLLRFLRDKEFQKAEAHITY